MSGLLDILNPANISAALPADLTQKIVESVAVGAASSVMLKGIKAGGLESLDPMGLFHKDAPAPTVTQVNNPAAVTGPTITASAFASLPPAAQGSILAAGGHIVAG